MRIPEGVNVGSIVGLIVGIAVGCIDGAIVGWTVMVVETTNETQWSVQNYISRHKITRFSVLTGRGGSWECFKK